MKETITTKKSSIRTGKSLLQRFGFNGFSFQHIADEVGVKKPSLYDHFDSKEAFGVQMMDDYLHSFERWAETVSGFKPEDRIQGLFDIFYKFSTDGLKYCPLAALSADFHTLPKSMKKSVQKMAEFQKDWLENTIKEGQKQKTFRQDLSSSVLSDLVFSLCIGSQMLARISEDPEKIKIIKKQSMEVLCK